MRRRQLVRTWLCMARAIADKTQDGEALAVVAFLSERAVVGFPKADNDLAYIRRRGIAKGEAVYIVPMISYDYWLLPPGDYWRGYATTAYMESYGVAEAEYFPPNQAIYMPGEWTRSEIQQGMVMLHEGLHAYDHLVKGKSMPKPFWRRERNARLMEMRLIKCIGGPEFVAYLDMLAPEVEVQYQRHRGDEFFFVIPRELSDDTLLDRLLWKVNTPIELRSRREDIERYAVTHYFEHRYGTRKGRSLYGKYVRDNYIAKAHPQHLRGLASSQTSTSA